MVLDAIFMARTYTGLRCPGDRLEFIDEPLGGLSEGFASFNSPARYCQGDPDNQSRAISLARAPSLLLVVRRCPSCNRRALPIGLWSHES